VSVKGRLRSVLRLAGKRDQKVAAVFGLSPESCHRAVLHLRGGAPDAPVWLFSTVPPWPETEALCERVCVRRGALSLLLRAQAELWPRWVALGVSTWTGEHGAWPLKLAPFAIPPFRAVLLNENGDFFGASSSAIRVHVGRRLRANAHDAINGLETLCELGLAKVRGRTLHAAATLLRWSGYPNRKLFAAMAGGERLDVENAPPRGAGVTRFTAGRSDWDWRVFERLVKTSPARWIFWSDTGDENIEDLLPLFRDRRTFAVSRQEHYRAWTPGMLPTAPFRALQPGECSRVLAPVSGAMLIDREKLAALGAPRSALPGAMWLTLFWKAAAAGWTSYSIGQNGNASRRPDQPQEEAEFFFRVLANRGLRRLGPADADLSRGCVATRVPPQSSPQTSPRRRDRPRVLVVSPFLPYPLSHGGAVRIYNLCRALAGRVDFALAAVREQNEAVDYDRLHEVFRQVYAVDLDETPAPGARLPKQVRHYNSRSLRALIAGVCRDWQPDLLQIEYTQMAAFRDAAPAVPALLVEHDITFSLYAQLAAGQPAGDAHAEYQRWREFESLWLRRFEGVWTVSEEDRMLAIREGSPPDRTFTIPNGVDTTRYAPCDEPAGGLEILYVGSFRHLPNVIAFDKLRRDIMPRVWERFPNVTLRVVAGPDHETFWHRFAHNGSARIGDRRIAIHGFVEDLRPLYTKAAVIVAPLEVSAGTNIKVLEAMACGKAVVTTPVGCAGLNLRDGADALIREQAASFADAVCDLLASRTRRQVLGVEARATAEHLFSWNMIAEQAYASYLSLISVHHSSSISDTPWRGSENSIGASGPGLETHLGDSTRAS
jgi:glycosyltransferase involved in cell wall biosynthesis